MISIKCKGVEQKVVERAKALISNYEPDKWFKTNNGRAEVAKVGQRYRIVKNLKTLEILLVSIAQYKKLIDRL
ncbi:MAG: hypothetical protein ACRCTW_11170 [Lactococcus garvieae]